MTTSTNTHSNFNSTGAPSTQARKHFGYGANDAGFSADRAIVINLLNQALTTEIASVFRYRRHHFTARGIQATNLATELLLHAKEELEHARKIAERIRQLGGKSEFNKTAHFCDSPMEYIAGHSALEIITANLVAERITIHHYLALISQIDGIDTISGAMLKTILVEEEVQAGALAHFLQYY